MTRSRQTHFVRSTTAPIERVWELLADHRGYPAWSTMTGAELEREGDPPPNGVGAIRVLRTGPGKSREEVVAFEPPTHLAYTLLSGLPAKDYRADVHLSPEPGGGTRIDWQSSFRSGPLTALIIRTAVGSFSSRLAKAAAQ